MNEPNYSKRETDLLLQQIKDSAKFQETQNAEIIKQTTKTNGSVAELKTRMDRTEKILYIVGTIVATLLITNGSELVGMIKLII